MIICLKVYQRDGNVSHHYKILFNTIITVLSLILGLNFLEVLKDMAKVLRWRILAAQPVTVREADLILGGDSLEKLFQLLWESRTKFWRGKFKWPKNILLMGCTFWIGLNFLAQASIALIGLNYSMDSGSNSNDTYFRPGTVLVAKLDCLYDDGNCPSGAPEANMTLAHTYGEMTRGRTVCSYASDANITAASQLCYYFSRTDGQEFAYRFSEFNPQDNTNAYPHLTNRNIRSTAGDCVEHALDTTSPAKLIDTPDGQHEAQVWSFGPPISTDDTPTYDSTITIPRPYAAFDSTTYIYNGTSPPDLTNAAEGIECGARCLRIYAFRSAGVRSNRTSALFSCPITLSTVYNQTSPAQDIPDAIARLAASSIALSGRYTNPYTSSPSTKSWQQYQLYPWGSYWEAAELDARGVGGLMARFAMGSIAGMVELNPQVKRPGLVPLMGYKLSVHWNFMIPLLCIIVGSHAILMLGILFVSRKVVVVDDSFFCVSRLVAPLMAQLGGNINGGTGESLISLTSPRAAQKGAVGGSLLDRKEVAEAIQGGPARQARKDDGDERNIEHIVYGIANSRGHSKDNRISRRSSGGEMKTLVLGEDVSVIGDLKFQRFPGGLYA